MEGSLEAPTRHTIPWQDEAWYDEVALEAELRRVYDICHGCRRCFNLCDSFPLLFDTQPRPIAVNVIDFGTGSDRATWEAVAQASSGTYQHLTSSASPELAAAVNTMLG